MSQMTDLHCHLLPGIDDGARDLNMSLALLRQEQAQGVTNLVFTSHFHPDEQDLHDFLKARNRAFGQLVKTLETRGPQPFAYKLGAEVYFSPMLSELDVSLLCFTRSPYLLIEFPFTREPAFIDRVLFDLMTRGVRPIIAHVERYEWLNERPEVLCDWANEGIVLQSNAGALLRDEKRARYIATLIDHNIVSVLSSDAHHPEHRPANLSAGYQAVADRLGEDTARELQENGNRIFRGEEILDRLPTMPKRRFGKWV